MKNYILKIILILLLITDIGYSFIQHFNMTMDGDMVSIILGCPELMKDPFGVSVLLHNKIYVAPNRFFVVAMMRGYFRTAPFLFQHITNPIDSIYLSIAFAKTFIQVFIIWLLASYISGTKNMLQLKFLIAAVLITPLFQTAGYNDYMGVINVSPTYALFYGWTLALLLLFFLPFFEQVIHKKQIKFNSVISVSLLLFTVVLSLSSAIVPGVALIICPMTILYFWKKAFDESTAVTVFNRIFIAFKTISSQLLFIFSFFCILSVYSIYIGRNNADNFLTTVSIAERYMRLPLGIYYIFTQKLGMPLLLFMIILNLFFISRQERNEETKKIFSHLKWIGIFCILYTLLLPIGGYRAYRPYIIKSDTFLPVLLSMFYLYGISTVYLLKNTRGKFKSIYLTSIIIFLFVFTISDISSLNENACERNALQTISESTEKIILLNTDCTVMEWFKVTDYHNSEANAELMQYWRITKEKKLYFQKQ
jgi:hypothetical protein